MTAVLSHQLLTLLDLKIAEMLKTIYISIKCIKPKIFDLLTILFFRVYLPLTVRTINLLNYKQKNKLLIIYQLKRTCVCSQICSKQIVPLIRRMIDLTAAMRVIELSQRK